MFQEMIRANICYQDFDEKFEVTLFTIHHKLIYYPIHYLFLTLSIIKNNFGPYYNLLLVIKNSQYSSTWNFAKELTSIT